jgi:glycerophosphoryl diester phosphodiesterase
MTAFADARILVHGHRGARAVLPENTLPAFEYAIAAGVDALELDLAVTSDNVLVVSHDPVMNPDYCTPPEGWTGTRTIREMTFAELRGWDCGARANPGFPRQKPVPGTRVPSLDEVFALAPRGTFGFNVETKIFAAKPELTPPPAEFARLLLDAIRRHKLENRVIVQSFDFRTLEAMRKMAPEVALSALHAPPGSGYVGAAKAVGARWWSPHYSIVTPELVEEAHKAGMKVVPWTANDASVWKKLAGARVDAIITDDPEALIAWLKQAR